MEAWSKLLVALGREVAGSIVVDESDMMRSKKVTTDSTVGRRPAYISNEIKTKIIHPEAYCLL